MSLVGGECGFRLELRVDAHFLDEELEVVVGQFLDSFSVFHAVIAHATHHLNT